MVMAETSAYFHVSYKVCVSCYQLSEFNICLQRIIDNITRVIDHNFLRSIGKELQSSLITGLSLATDQASEKAAIYLAEDEQVASQRVYLEQKKNRLDGVLKRLFNFGA